MIARYSISRTLLVLIPIITAAQTDTALPPPSSPRAVVMVPEADPGADSAASGTTASTGDSGMVKTRTVDLKLVEKKDTILVLTGSSFRDIVSKAHDIRSSARQRGYGGSLGPSFGMLSLDMAPIRELATAARDLKAIGFSFDSDYSNMLISGGMGYGGVGKGTRLGGGGWGGSRQFSTPSVADTLDLFDVDSIYTLDISVGFGGFLVEKAFVLGDLNVFLGGMFGGGSIKAALYGSEADVSLGFAAPPDNDNDSPPVKASFLLLEMHGGVTYSLASWFHLGIEVFCPFFISSNGFRNRLDRRFTSSFTTANPGVRLRISLGNLG